MEESFVQQEDVMEVLVKFVKKWIKAKNFQLKQKIMMK